MTLFQNRIKLEKYPEKDWLDILKKVKYDEYPENSFASSRLLFVLIMKLLERIEKLENKEK